MESKIEHAFIKHGFGWHYPEIHQRNRKQSSRVQCHQIHRQDDHDRAFQGAECSMRMSHEHGEHLRQAHEQIRHYNCLQIFRI